MGLGVVARGDTKAAVVGHDGLRFDLRVVPGECYGNVLQHFTGSKDRNIALREEAQRRGFSISEYGVTTVETGEVVAFERGRPLRLPRLRACAAGAPRGHGDLGLARTGTPRPRRAVGSAWRDALPLVVVDGCEEHDRGDGASGRVAAIRFLCLTDHSHYLRDGRLEAQWEEIAAVNALVKPFRVLRGIEVNIRADGSLDVEDDVLEELDWVIASLHTSFDRSPTERILGAIDNPHVDCIGHLTGRRLLKRDGAAVDVERVVERAVETGTALEINSQSDRLDMRDTHARLAGEAGVIPITTDAHSVGALAYAELGVAQARRGWLTKEQVLNTRSWRDIERLRK